MQRYLENALEHSNYITRWFTAKPLWQKWVAERIETPLTYSAIEAIFDELETPLVVESYDERQLMKALREARQKMMLWLGVRDLANLASLDEVTQAMTAFAEIAVAKAMAVLSQDLAGTHGTPKRANGLDMPLWIVGMGKLGGRELNVSSDIDLIFVYEDEGETQGASKSLSHHEWFSRLGKRLIKVLSEVTEDGFVFRVDMRLRPNGDSGPLVCSLGMLEEYFMVQGREWERYAWIKGRLIYPLEEAGVRGLPENFYEVVRPFVFRRYLDFGVIAAIRDLHGQIQREAVLRATQFPERAADLKLGRGGIREIEFLAQMFQLIRGGQEPKLRERPTVVILQDLVELGLMDRAVSEGLQNAYSFLRRVEHRIQWWDDAQIHYLPTTIESQERIANGLGYSTRDAFYDELKRHQDLVAEQFSSAFVLSGEGAESTNLDDWQPSSELYPNLATRWDGLKSSSRYRAMNDAARKSLASLLKRAAEMDGLASEATLISLLDFLETISRRSSYLSLLTEYPQALGRVMQLLQASKWGANYLVKHPHLLDEMLMSSDRLSPETDPKVYWQQWRANLTRRLDDVMTQSNAQELMMDILRNSHHAEIFQILLADLGIGREKNLPVEFISDRLSALADVILQETLSRIWRELALKYGFDPDFSRSGFGVIAYGKLGGKELGYGSDLDLVFLFDEKQCPIDPDLAPERFAMLVRRLILWLTSATSAGTLFEIDTRLRPNGSAGLMVTNIDSFEAYQLREGGNAAWIWEHQALTRARFCAGDERIGQRFDQIRSTVLSSASQEANLLAEILKMRQKIHEGHPNPSGDFDLKHDSGGMVDVEFAVQYLVLANANRIPELLANIGNIGLLKLAATHQLLDKAVAEKAANAYRLLRERQHRFRLDGHDRSRVSDMQMDQDLLQAKQAVEQLWATVMRV